MHKVAQFLFYGSLNDFLKPAEKVVFITYPFAGSPAVKDAIEAIGVPHTEVAAIHINQTPADFKTRLQPQDQVEVYPINAGQQSSLNNGFTNSYEAGDKFILDVHLGKLARELRLLGFDAIYQNHYDDATIARIAALENRIVLTRDVGLLKHSAVRRGYWLRSQQPTEQLLEVINYYQLRRHLQPFSRCIACNGSISPVPKAAVLEQLPPKTRLYFEEFFQCQSCERVYWKGSHYDRMQTFLKNIITTLHSGSSSAT